MNIPNLVFIAGRRGAGKGEIAEYLMREHRFSTIKLADPLKDMLRVFLKEYLGFNHEMIERHIEGNLKEAPIPLLGGNSTRELMQTLGTEWGRQLVPDMWINIAIARIQRKVSRRHRVVVDDMRFPNEANVAQKLGAKLWLVESTKNWRDDAEARPATPLRGEFPLPEGGGQTPFFLRNIARKMTRSLYSHILDDGEKFDWVTPNYLVGGKTSVFVAESIFHNWILDAVLGSFARRQNKNTHVSETPLPKSLFSSIIYNNGTKQELYNQVEMALHNAHCHTPEGLELQDQLTP